MISTCLHVPWIVEIESAEPASPPILKDGAEIRDVGWDGEINSAAFRWDGGMNSDLSGWDGEINSALGGQTVRAPAFLESQREGPLT